MTEVKMKDAVPNAASMERAGKLTRAAPLLLLPHSNHGSTRQPFCSQGRGNRQPDDDRPEGSLLKLSSSTSPGECSWTTQLLSTGKGMGASGVRAASIVQCRANPSVCCGTLWPGNSLVMQHKPKLMKGILASQALAHCKERKNDPTELDKADSGDTINLPIK